MSEVFRSSCIVVALAVAGCGGAPELAPATLASIPEGEWALMRFLGGPPPEGQITDTLRVDPARSRHVRIDRSRAGGPDSSCELEAPDDAAWSALLHALNDPALHAAPLPPLMIDAGYFACDHAGTRLAVSDLAPPDSQLTPDVVRARDALRRLDAAHARLRDELLALPPCAAL